MSQVLQSPIPRVFKGLARGAYAGNMARSTKGSRPTSSSPSSPAPRSPSSPKVPPLVGVIMGSKSDWETIQHTCAMLDQLKVPYEVSVVSAHRTPDLLMEYAASAEGRGIQVIIAGAGGAAHLPGMAASKTILPVLGVPVESHALKGMDSLLSIVQMPAGVPVGTLAIGKAGATNAALLASEIIALHDEAIRERVRAYRTRQTQTVLADRTLP